jgi:hypothetical protein
MEYNIKMDPDKIQWEGMDLVHMAQDRASGRVL